MYATAAFEFDQSDNGWLMSEFAFMRSVFLIFLFPPIIDVGRRFWTGDIDPSTRSGEDENGNYSTTNDDALPTAPGEFDVSSLQGDTEPIKPVASRSDAGNVYTFDLVFLRWSLIIDGALTTVAAFATKPWHIYLGKVLRHPICESTLTTTAAFLLPFGSGSAPAAKGVITEMTPESQRADALNAVTLIENVARLATQGSFGFIFASLASRGIAYATFFCNAVSPGHISSQSAISTNGFGTGSGSGGDGRLAILQFPSTREQDGR